MAFISRLLRAYFRLYGEWCQRRDSLYQSPSLSSAGVRAHRLRMNTIKGMQSLSLCGPGEALGA